MNDIFNLIDNFSGKYHDRLLKITEPLRQHFGITYFAYQRVTHQGEWMIVGNNPEWLTYSAGNQFYKHDPSLVNPTFYQSGYCFPAVHKDPDFQNTLARASVELFDLNHALAIVEKTVQGCDYYFLAAPTKNDNVIDTYVNHASLLRNSFIESFKDELMDVLPRMTDYAVNLKEINHDVFTSHDHLLSLSHSNDFIANEFLVDIKSRGRIRSSSEILLTARENDCLKHYQLGYTAKETARILSLSPRTVEEYLDKVKFKYGCKYKRELLRIPS